MKCFFLHKTRALWNGHDHAWQCLRCFEIAVCALEVLGWKFLVVVKYSMAESDARSQLNDGQVHWLVSTLPTALYAQICSDELLILQLSACCSSDYHVIALIGSPVPGQTSSSGIKQSIKNQPTSEIVFLWPDAWTSPHPNNCNSVLTAVLKEWCNTVIDSSLDSNNSDLCDISDLTAEPS